LSCPSRPPVTHRAAERAAAVPAALCAGHDVPDSDGRLATACRGDRSGSPRCLMETPAADFSLARGRSGLIDLGRPRPQDFCTSPTFRWRAEVLGWGARTRGARAARPHRSPPRRWLRRSRGCHRVKWVSRPRSQSPQTFCALTTFHRPCLATRVHLKIVESDLRRRSHGKPGTLRCQNGARGSVEATYTRPQSAHRVPCDRRRRPVPAAVHNIEVHPGDNRVIADRNGLVVCYQRDVSHPERTRSV